MGLHYGYSLAQVLLRCAYQHCPQLLPPVLVNELVGVKLAIGAVVFETTSRDWHRRGAKINRILLLA